MIGGKEGIGMLLPFALALLLLPSPAFAASEPPQPQAPAPDYTYFWLALLIPVAVVAIAYMGSYAFNAPALRAVLQDELLQILATGAVALTLVGTQAVVDQYAVATVQAAGVPGASGIQSALDAAAAKITGLEDIGLSLLSNMEEVSSTLGMEASRGVFCNFMGTGFSLSNCSPLNAYRGSLTAAAFTTTVAISDTYAQDFLLSLARSYAFTLIIPMGLLLRCFKASRAAGGALIAIGFGFYTVYPVVILLTDNLLHGNSMPAVPSIPMPGECDPREPKVTNSLAQFTEYGEQLTGYGLIYGMAYQVLVRILFLSILNLIITLSFIRAFAHIIGSEIDVSSLARIS
jgi:hypothetical protein